MHQAAKRGGVMDRKAKRNAGKDGLREEQRENGKRSFKMDKV